MGCSIKKMQYYIDTTADTGETRNYTAFTVIISLGYAK